MVESVRDFGYCILPWVAIALLYYINSNVEQVRLELRRLRLENTKSLKWQEMIIGSLFDTGEYQKPVEDPAQKRRKPLGNDPSLAPRLLQFAPRQTETASGGPYKLNSDQRLDSEPV